MDLAVAPTPIVSGISAETAAIHTANMAQAAHRLRLPQTSLSIAMLVLLSHVNLFLFFPVLTIPRHFTVFLTLPSPMPWMQVHEDMCVYISPSLSSLRIDFTSLPLFDVFSFLEYFIVCTIYVCQRLLHYHFI